MSSKGATGSVVMTGIGMRTPLGHHAIQTTASWRSGLSRLVESRYLKGSGPEGRGVAVGEVPGAGGDRAWTEKAFDLMVSPTLEALERAQMLERFALGGRPAAVTLYVATPAAQREGVGVELYEEWLEELLEYGLLPFPPVKIELVSADHASALIALSQAVRTLESGAIDAAVVCGVDSFLHSEYLDALAEEGRLKAGDRPSGLLGGEGGAAVVLERARDVAARRGPPPLARVLGVGVDHEKAPIGTDHPLEGAGLSRAVRAALGNHGATELQHVFADLNGERWRFLEWSLVETRCLSAAPHGWQLHHPADGMGDLGAAAPLVAAGLYGQGLARGYHRGGCLITASSWSGERAAARLGP